jgi:hypothetical protein
MKKIALVLTLAAFAAVPAAAKGPLAPPLLALVSHGKVTYLEKVDPVTLDQRAGRVLTFPLETSFLATSPKHRYVALATGSTSRIRFVDLRTMRTLRAGYTLYGGPAGALWSASGLVVLMWGDRFYTMDSRGRHAQSHPLDGKLAAVARGSSKLVALLAPNHGLGPATLAVIDEAGNARTTTLPGVVAGIAEVDTEMHGLRSETPGVAISPDGTHAVVVQRSNAVVDVDLATLRATPHTIAARTLAKSMDGGQRVAAWVGDTVAVSGVDAKMVDDVTRMTPAGLTLINTRTWTSRRVNTFATLVTAAADAVVAYGAGWDAALQKATGDGVAGYGENGAVRFHLFRGRPVDGVQAEGRYAYIPALDRSKWTVVELASGRVVNDGAAGGLQALLDP